MDNIEKIKATTEWMAEHYAKANQELFDGKLMECSFQIKTIGSRTLGQFHVDGGYNRLLVDRYSRRMFIKNSFSGDKQLINKENFVQLCHPVIFMNSNYSGTEVSLYTTLVHEMCHYYTYMYGYCPKQGHGSEFRDIASLVSYRSHGLFTIQRLASAEEMSGYELDDKVKQQIEKRKENKINRLSYLIIVTKNGDMRLVNTANMGLINKIVDLHDKRGEKVFKLLNHDIAQELYKLGFNSEMRTYKYWTLNKDSIIVKQIFASPENYKNLTDDYLTENIMNKKLKHNTIEITPDMDLGQYSPLEILNENKSMKIKESVLRKIIRENIMRLSSVDNINDMSYNQDDTDSQNIMKLSGTNNTLDNNDVQNQLDEKPDFMFYDKVEDMIIGMDDFKEINRMALGCAIRYMEDNVEDWYPLTITDTHLDKVIVSFDNIGIHSHYNNKEFTWEEYNAIMKRKQIFNANNMKITESKLRKIIRESLEEITGIHPDEKQMQMNQDWEDIQNQDDALQSKFNRHQMGDDRVRNMYVQSHPEEQAALNAMQDMDNPYYASDDSYANGEEWRF